jgi:ribosomal protein S18 acetylase RimI-like enzyme
VEIKIRKMQTDDAMQVAAMNELLAHTDEKATRADAQFFREHVLEPNGIATIYVAAEGKKIAGFIGYRDWPSFATKKKVRQIDLLYVDEEYEGFGIATDLLEHVRLDAVQSGCGRLDIQTESSNEGSNALYKKFGFESKPDTRKHYRMFLD